MRFILIGIGLTFAGFLVLGVMGSQYQAATFESDEFGTCYEYFEDKPPQEINCSFKIMDQTVFFGLVIGLLGAGVIALIKGVRGDWDRKVKPEDIVGPGNTENEDSERKQD
ncbi:hypothetical protein [Nitrosopumilus sp. b2]|uniref:hypothetical protein n=1 Tax=Nitrosopumilus sp. b2 TaxID=2109908 RepID=UPI0015F54769|nr:hypothetical protein [Nitrosopumilus sp. b2]KAF6244801.1 hypothetical protein C6989_06735 [Nitrosopumilus sp. b2]